jgi:hypothetical protein
MLEEMGVTSGLSKLNLDQLGERILIEKSKQAVRVFRNDSGGPIEYNPLAKLLFGSYRKVKYGNIFSEKKILLRSYI